MASELTTLADVRGISAPAKVYLWEMVIPQIPGAVAAASRELTLRARDAVIPGFTTMTQKSYFKGAPLKHPSRRDFPGTFALKLEESVNADVMRIIDAWNQLWHNDDTGEGQGESGFLVPAFLRQLDHAKQVVVSFKFRDVFPESKVDTPLSYAGQELLNYDLVFGYSSWVLE